MEGLEAKRDQLAEGLRNCEAPPAYNVHPRAVDHYRRLVERLHIVLADNDAQGVRDAFRGLLDRVVFIPQEGRGQFELELHGRLGALLTKQQNTLPGVTEEGAFMLGAGTGFEPVTFRL